MINILDKSVAELIAAGEVIERPASIVKELVENAIDANSTAITVEIRHGGITYIRVTDNGCGIDPGDVKNAFLRHATSKVKSVSDLDCIGTLGFRGEALASIAAVSHIEITTKTHQLDFATKLTLDDGEVEQVGSGNGTTIIVSDLFYNVPARLKFLKRDQTEGNVIVGIVEKLALSNPQISFKLICDYKVKLLTPGDGKLLSVIHTVFGREFAMSLAPISYEYGGVKINGFTSKTDYSRPNRSMQHFFVNSRYVRSKTCTAGIEEGYKNSIMVGKFPACVIDVQIDYGAVDVNVHPSKIEVRFVNERAVFDALFFAVKSAIATSNQLSEIAFMAKPSTKVNVLSTFKSEESDQQSLIQMPSHTDYHKELVPPKSNVAISDSATGYSANSTQSFNYITPESLTQPIKNPPVIKLEVPLEPVTENTIQVEYVKLIGELFKTYILFEVSNSFVMIDKHAAHERIIFDKLKSTIKTDQRQLLIKPITLNLSTAELIALTTNVPLVEEMGFLLEEFGNNTLLIREAPLILVDYNLADILLDIAGKLCENKRDTSSDIFEHLLQSMACRLAIKANDFTGENELLNLVSQVLNNDELRHCPHGRPIATVISKNEIEKRFGRLQ